MAHLLIVEASQSLRYSMIRTLEHAGHAVAAADSADAALILMAHGQYDMLLTTGNGANTSAALGDLPSNVRVQPVSTELDQLASQVESALAA